MPSRSRAAPALSTDDLTRSMAGTLVRAADALRMRGETGAAIAACDEAMTIAEGLGDSELGAAALGARGDARSTDDALVRAGRPRARHRDARGARARTRASGAASPPRDEPSPARAARSPRIAPEVAREHARAAADAAESIDDARGEAEAQIFLAAACW